MAETAADTKAFKPYIPDETRVPEFTLRAVGLGMLFGVIFGAVTVYVGLRAGLTVGASIPIAVLSISVLRALGKATILENNIVQTTGSAALRRTALRSSALYLTTEAFGFGGTERYGSLGWLIAAP